MDTKFTRIGQPARGRRVKSACCALFALSFFAGCGQSAIAIHLWPKAKNHDKDQGKNESPAAGQQNNGKGGSAVRTGKPQSGQPEGRPSEDSDGQRNSDKQHQDQSLDKNAVQDRGQKQGTDRSPNQGTDRSPNQGPDQGPDQSLNQGEGSAQSSGQSANQGEGSAQSSGQRTSREHGQERSSGQSENQNQPESANKTLDPATAAAIDAAINKMGNSGGVPIDFVPTVGGAQAVSDGGKAAPAEDPMAIYRRCGVSLAEERKIRQLAQDFEGMQRVRLKLLMNMLAEMKQFELQTDPDADAVLAKQEEINKVTDQMVIERMKLLLKIRDIMSFEEKQRLVETLQREKH